MQFSINRFWLLTRKQLADNKQLYLLGMLALAGIMLCLFLFGISMRMGLIAETQQIFFFMGLLATGSIFTSTILSQFNEKTKAIQALSIPASTLEKLLTAIVASLVLYPLAYFIVTYPIMLFTHYIDVNIVGHVNTLYDFTADRTTELIMLYLFLQTIVLLFSVVFKRYTFIKTAILVVGVFTGMQAFNTFIAQHAILPQQAEPVIVHQPVYAQNGTLIPGKFDEQKVTPQIMASPLYGVVYISNHYNTSSKQADTIKIKPARIGELLFSILFIISIPFLWTITWFRLKETVL